jgi:RNA polymerase sigma-70 factor (ECF subfamily)
VTDRDEDLVRIAVAGDPEAFATLVRRHERRIYNVCLRMVGSPDDAGDATQDAFLTAYRKLGTFRGDAAFTTWLHRIALNACYDMLRKRRRTASLVSSEGEELTARLASVDDPADDSIAAIDVQRALSAVPHEFRVALVLHDVHDVPVREVAAILEIPVGTVKSRLHRGRVALARQLAPEPSPADRPSKDRRP